MTASSGVTSRGIGSVVTLGNAALPPPPPPPPPASPPSSSSTPRRISLSKSGEAESCDATDGVMNCDAVKSCEGVSGAVETEVDEDKEEEDAELPSASVGGEEAVP